jgi:hypothetical protein
MDFGPLFKKATESGKNYAYKDWQKTCQAENCFHEVFSWSIKKGDQE